MQYITFYVGDTIFGINILLMNEINRHLDYTTTEGGPDYIRGLLNLRGKIVALMDLGTRMGVGEREIGEQSRCIILKTNQEISMAQGEASEKTSDDVVGLLVDRIGDLQEVDDRNIERVPANLETVDIQYLSGVVKLNEQIVSILNLKELLKFEN